MRAKVLLMLIAWAILGLSIDASATHEFALDGKFVPFLVDQGFVSRR